MSGRTCILVELTDGAVSAFAYPDEEIAATHLDECRSEWNAGRSLIASGITGPCRVLPPPPVDFSAAVGSVPLLERIDSNLR